MPRVWQADYDEPEHILIVEIELPNVVHRPPIKFVERTSGLVAKPLNQTERRELVPQIHPAIMLRVALEIFRNAESSVVQLLALNGWVSFHHPHTGLDTRAYTASLLVEREQIVSLNLNRIDPLAAFQALKGKSAGKLIEIIPIEPTLNMKRTDSRFVDARDVLESLGTNTNLAAMDWQDFEHLIRELFEKEFSGRGTEVKITQTSRDRGVDAIVFNPDPIHGGKYIIQAKRYTNTVNVSAVRDLCAVVDHEGASRGILVTTSTYGADAYAFASNKPITLLNGAELLGLLRKHGYQFRVDLAEARRMRVE
jgi:restriction system protein